MWNREGAAMSRPPSSDFVVRDERTMMVYFSCQEQRDDYRLIKGKEQNGRKEGKLDR
jgi:hypothetical protein